MRKSNPAALSALGRPAVLGRPASDTPRGPTVVDITCDRLTKLNDALIRANVSLNGMIDRFEGGPSSPLEAPTETTPWALSQLLNQLEGSIDVLLGMLSRIDPNLR